MSARPRLDYCPSKGFLYRWLKTSFLLPILLSQSLISLAQSPDSLVLAQQMFVSYYGRPGDPDGVNYWADQFDMSSDLAASLSAFGRSEEYSDRFGDFTDEQLVNGLFQQMFNRDVEPAGLEFYTDRLASGAATLASIAKQIADGATDEDLLSLNNKVAVANEFTLQITAGNIDYESLDIPAAQEIIQLVGASPDSVAVGEAAVAQWVAENSLLSDHQSLALIGSMHGSNRLLEVYEIEAAIEAWMQPFQHANFTELPYGKRPVWHLKVTQVVPPDAYIAEIKYVSALGFRVVATLKLPEEQRLTDESQRTELMQRIETHIDMLCEAGACPDVFSVDNEPDIDPAPESGSFELWNAYALTLDTIAEALIAAKNEHGIAIALPAIGLFGHWPEFGSQAIALMGDRMNEFDVWLYHVYDHPPSFQAIYDLETIAREKTGNSTIEVIASETAVGFIKAGETQADKPWVQGELGALYFAAQVASSLMTGIEPCHFLLVNVDTGIIRRPDLEQSLRQQVAGWFGDTLFAPGFILDSQRSSLSHDSFHIVTSDGERDRALIGRYLPRLVTRSVRRALTMAHPQLTAQEIENLAGIEEETQALLLSFEGRDIPAPTPGATVLHQMSHEGEENQISWFVIEESASANSIQ